MDLVVKGISKLVDAVCYRGFLVLQTDVATDGRFYSGRTGITSFSTGVHDYVVDDIELR